MAGTQIHRTDATGVGRDSITTALGAVVALSVVACVLFTWVAIHEMQYAGDHPFAYGPAKVIATAAAAGALLSISVAVLGRALLRRDR